MCFALSGAFAKCDQYICHLCLTSNHSALLCFCLQATGQATLSALLVRLISSSKLQVSAFLISLVFGSDQTNDAEGNEAVAIAASSLHSPLKPDETRGIPQLAKCVSSILPALINGGVVDQQFAWPLLRVLLTPASSSAQIEGAATLLTHFHATNEQIKTTMESAEQHGSHWLSGPALATLETFIAGHPTNAGVSLHPVTERPAPDAHWKSGFTMAYLHRLQAAGE